MTVKVSVVVPVYNPGRYFSYCLDSVLAQSMPVEDFEVIFVDDGSTDGTAECLDELAAAHPHISVIHIPNSGWPGRPRNIGTDAARGKYVHFLDADDALGTEALERLYAYAEENCADIVFGRYAGHHRAVAREIFRTNRPVVTDRTLLATSLTAHKMFRADFLRRHHLRFPEGRRRLEDQHFLVKAYLLTDRVSVLSEYVSYYHTRRDDGGSAAFQPLVPSVYYGNLAEVMDAIEEYAKPGPVKDAFSRRCLRTEMLSRLASATFLDQERGYQQDLFRAVHDLDAARTTDQIRDLLPPIDRLRARLLQRGDIDGMIAYCEHVRGTKGRATITDAQWRDGVLEFDFELEMVTRDGDPVRYVQHDDDLLLSVPDSLTGLPAADRSTRGGAATAVVDFVVRLRADSAEFYTGVTTTAEIRPAGDGMVTVHHRGRARFDAQTWALGAPLWDGIWDFYLRVTTVGFEYDARVGVLRTDRAAIGLIRDQIVTADRMVHPYWTEVHDNLSVRIGPIPKSAVTGPYDGLTVSGRALTIPVPFDVAPAALPAVTVRLTHTVTGRAIRMPVTAGPDGSVLVRPGGRWPGIGQWTVGLQIGGHRGAATSALVVRALRRPAVRPARAPGWVTTRAVHLVRRARRIARRLPWPRPTSG